MADEVEGTPRQEFQFTLTTTTKGKIRVKMFDRINVDDLFVHLVNRHLFRLVTTEEPSDEIAERFKDFLIRENYIVGSR
jgi:hypothetical protein